MIEAAGGLTLAYLASRTYDESCWFLGSTLILGGEARIYSRWDLSVYC